MMLATARRAEAHLSREDVTGVVVTYGTDTIEDTAP
jgi:L-asparaginase/Glu-tRNA(Gln) amidotransferase subunit D